MKRFELATAARIVFGPGCSAELPSLAAELGSRALFVTGSRPDRSAEQQDALRRAGLALEVLSVSNEPDIAAAERVAAAARHAGCDLVIAMGGGSALDAGKAAAALAANPGEALDYLEVVGRGRALPHDPLPVIAVPTTAGTGSEVTRNAVLASPAERVKVSMRHARLLPRLALVDPSLCLSVPPSVTAATGLDALTQCIEPFLSKRANPLCDAICRQGIQLAARSLRRAFEDGRDLEARCDMSLASLCGGLALANAGLGAAHGFAGPIGGMFPGAPHGAVCARLLPHVLEANLAALCARAPGSPAIDRFDELGRLLTGRPGARAADGIDLVRALCEALAVPPLSAYGLSEDDLDSVVDRAERASSMKANPVELTRDELARILQAAI
ncbi:MAG: iron-containing alcohol dehydrogenase [Deltaproteobacteria bacterium]|nr:iron-containing alcohol dehydrogenase [Deltaproteobacteria bacterium]